MKATLMRTDGTQEEITPVNGEDFSLEECYKHIGCELIQVLFLPNNTILIVDEEGLLKNDWKVNRHASRLVVAAHVAEGIVGNAILCPSSYLK